MPTDNTDFHARRLQKRLDNANIPRMFRGWTWSDLRPYRGDTVEIARGWADMTVAGKTIEADSRHCGKGLLLRGKPGHGKTALASVVLQEVLRNSTLQTWGAEWNVPYQPSRPAYMTYYRKLTQMMQRQFNNSTTEEENELLLDVTGVRFPSTALKLLVLDDVGKEHRTASGWASGLMEGILRDRYYSGYPTIITTNLTAEEWLREYGESSASFVKEAFAVLDVQSPEGDRR